MKYIILLLTSIFVSCNTSSTKMEKSSYKIEGLTLAITNMDQMLDFYSGLFNIQFEEKEMYGTTLFSGTWDDLNLLFCPAEIAGNTAKQNRHQFDVVVPDINKTIELAISKGGKLMGEITEDEFSRSAGIYDPDDNSIVFKELKK